MLAAAAKLKAEISLNGPATGLEATAGGYNPATNLFISFGGCCGWINTTWNFSDANGVSGPSLWQLLSPNGSPPSPRTTRAYGYDAALNELFVVGGWQNGSDFNGVWALTSADGSQGQPTWVNLLPDSANPPQLDTYGPDPGFYDPITHRLMVLFHGGGASGRISPQPWVLDLSPASPPANLSAVVWSQSVRLSWGFPQTPPVRFNIYADEIVNGAPLDLGLVDSVFSTGYTVTYVPGIFGPPLNGHLYRFRVTSVYADGESAPAFILAQPGGFIAPPHPYHRVLFLHGIDENAASWSDTASFLSNTLHWTCGGVLSYGPNDDPAAGRNGKEGPPYPSDCVPGQAFSESGDYFAVNFGNNLAIYQNGRAGIYHQGDEVSGFIKFLHPTPTSKLSIVAHSMGGLAARSYMQITDPSSAPNLVSDLTTLGTPHWGVDTTSLDTAVREGLTLYGPLVLALFPDALGIIGSQGLQDMNGACVANGDSTDPAFLSPFLKDLDSNPIYPLPAGPRYTVVSGKGYSGYIGVFGIYVFDPCVPPWKFKLVETDLVVPTVSSTLAGLVPASPPWSALTTPRNHIELLSEFPAILCGLDPNCLLVEKFSPIDILVTAPNGNAISNVSTSMPGAEYSTVTDASGDETATVIIPFPQGGQYTITATPKPGAKPTDTFTILQIQNGVTTTIAQDMPIQSIPPTGFQTVVKNGTSTLNYSPESIDFGNVVVGRKGKHVVTFENMGSTKASIGSVSLTVNHGNLADFSITQYCGANLGAGKDCTIAVYFAPQSVETGSATLSIATDASAIPLQIPITGAGVVKK